MKIIKASKLNWSSFNLPTLLIASSLLSLGVSTWSQAAEVNISGSTTTFPIVVKPYVEAVEASTKIKLNINPSNTGKGLVDLVEGRVSISMVSEPLIAAVAAAKFTGKDVDQSKLQLHTIKEVEYGFIVNNANPISKLSKDQIRDILTGKIANWKEIGGSDTPISIYTDGASSGTSAILKMVHMDGQDFGSNRKALDTIVRVPENVSNFKGAFGMITLSLITPGQVKVIDAGGKFNRPLGFLTMGAPTGDTLKVLEAFKAKNK